MAFRVLRSDLNKSEYIGKKIRRYDQTGELKINQKYFSIEKVADLLSAPEQDEPHQAPAKKLAAPVRASPPNPVESSETTVTEIAPSPTPAEGVEPAKQTAPPTTDSSLDVEEFDQDLDEGNSQNLNKGPDATTSDEDEDENGSPHHPFEVEESSRFDHYDNMLGFGVGYFKNMSNFSLNSVSLSGFDIFYSHVLNRDIWFQSKTSQDDLSIDFGLQYYRLVNIDLVNDQYTMIPLSTELRYAIHISPSFAVHGYLGLQYNFIASMQNVDSAGANKQTYNDVHGPQANTGIGVMFNLGPQWYLRVDLGLDRTMVGLAIKW